MNLDVDGNALSIVLQLKFNETPPFCSAGAVSAESLLIVSCYPLAFFSSMQFQDKPREKSLKKKNSWILILGYRACV